MEDGGVRFGIQEYTAAEDFEPGDVVTIDQNGFARKAVMIDRFTHEPPLSGETTTMTNDKLAARIAELGTLAREAIEAGADPGTVFSVIAACRNGLNREMKRAATLPAEFERVELVTARGPVVEFTGRLMRQDAFDVAAGKVRLEVWQTEGGALVAVDSFDNGEDGERIKVCTPSGGIEDQRMAIMEFFGWTNRARSMARKLGWSVRRDVD